MFAQTAPKLKVVASTSDLAALAAEVGGDRIVVESIVRGSQDPHFVESKPSYLLKLAACRRPHRCWAAARRWLAKERRSQATFAEFHETE